MKITSFSTHFPGYNTKFLLSRQKKLTFSTFTIGNCRHLEIYNKFNILLKQFTDYNSDSKPCIYCAAASFFCETFLQNALTSHVIRDSFHPAQFLHRQCGRFTGTCGTDQTT